MDWSAWTEPVERARNAVEQQEQLRQRERAETAAAVHAAVVDIMNRAIAQGVADLEPVFEQPQAPPGKAGRFRRRSEQPQAARIQVAWQLRHGAWSLRSSGDWSYVGAGVSHLDELPEYEVYSETRGRLSGLELRPERLAGLMRSLVVLAEHHGVNFK